MIADAVAGDGMGSAAGGVTDDCGGSANFFGADNINKALQTQLRLKLARKDPIDVLVVDQTSEVPADN